MISMGKLWSDNYGEILPKIRETFIVSGRYTLIWLSNYIFNETITNCERVFVCLFYLFVRLFLFERDIFAQA